MDVQDASRMRDLDGTMTITWVGMTAWLVAWSHG
jgi:hypothetical protein